VTGDITQIIAQLPPMVEALTGIKLEELIKRIPMMAASSPVIDATPEEKK